MSNETVQTNQAAVNAGGATEASTNTVSQETNVNQNVNQENNVSPETQSEDNSNINSEQDKQGETTQEPKTLSEAMQMTVERDAERSAEAVESGETGDRMEQDNVSESDSSGSSQTTKDNNNSGEVSGNNLQSDNNTDGSTESDQTGGEPTDGTPVFNRQQYLAAVDKSISDNVESQIVNAVKQMSTEDAIKAGVKIYTTEELIDPEAQKEGYIRFINPDTKEPFADRASANEWVNAVNEMAKGKLNQLRSNMINETRKQAAGGVELQIFLNETFSKVTDEAVQKEFVKLITPYQVTDTAGKVYKYNCDLNRALTQAENNVKAAKYDAMQSGNATAPADNPVSTPATDAKTSRGTAEKEPEVGDIKTLADAILFDQEQRKKEK